MIRLLFFLFVLTGSFSCSDNEEPRPADAIPDFINGEVIEFNATPLDITTPDRALVLISMTNTIYKVETMAVDQSQFNAILSFASDSILTGESREFANQGKDAIAYKPVAANVITIIFNDGRKVTGLFDSNTSFGGVFGDLLISQWRDSVNPTRPNQKAKDDLSNFVRLYSDKDGPGPDVSPVYLIAQVSKL